MSKKQSSVDWLVEELNHNIEFIPLAHWDKIRDIVQQAKAMHRKEIEDSWLDGVGNWDSEKEAEQYYNETFGGQGE